MRRIELPAALAFGTAERLHRLGRDPGAGERPAVRRAPVGGAVDPAARGRLAADVRQPDGARAAARAGQRPPRARRRGGSAGGTRRSARPVPPSPSSAPPPWSAAARGRSGVTADGRRDQAARRARRSRCRSTRCSRRWPTRAPAAPRCSSGPCATQDGGRGVDRARLLRAPERARRALRAVAERGRRRAPGARAGRRAPGRRPRGRRPRGRRGGQLRAPRRGLRGLPDAHRRPQVDGCRSGSTRRSATAPTSGWGCPDVATTPSRLAWGCAYLGFDSDRGRSSNAGAGVAGDPRGRAAAGRPVGDVGQPRPGRAPTRTRRSRSTSASRRRSTPSRRQPPARSRQRSSRRSRALVGSPPCPAASVDARRPQASSSVLLSAVAALLPVPVRRAQPGPTTNTLGAVGGTELIRIDGHQTYPDKGHLDLTTVSVLGGPAAAAGPRDRAARLARRLDRRRPRGARSIPRARAPSRPSRRAPTRCASRRRTRRPRRCAASASRSRRTVVVAGPAGRLAVQRASCAGGDVIVSVDGKRGRPAGWRCATAITAHKPGDTVHVRRATATAKRATVTVTTARRPSDGRAMVGVVTRDRRLPVHGQHQAARTSAARAPG